MNIELTYHQDPSPRKVLLVGDQYGWVFLDNTTLADLALNRDSFSRGSYKDSTGVYTEEESVAGILIDAMNKKGINFTFKELLKPTKGLKR